MKIAAIVILYHPAKDTIANINTYRQWVDRIFVFDNSETASAIKDDLVKLSKLEFHQDFNNEGIARRLNEGCRKAIDEKFDWVLTMDQDTSFEAMSISNYFNCFHKYEGKEKVGMFGTRFSRNNQEVSNDCSATEAKKLITSGSLLNLSLFKTIGAFDEKLFIDAVDYDYCFRTQMAGFSIIEFSNIYIRHTVGNEVNRSSVKTLFLVKKRKEVHSALRCYYMYRNLLYLNEKYKGQDKTYAKQISDYVLSRIKVSLLYGRNTKNILKYLKIARSDFDNNQMGKIKT